MITNFSERNVTSSIQMSPHAEGSVHAGGDSTFRKFSKTHTQLKTFLYVALSAFMLISLSCRC